MEEIGIVFGEIVILVSEIRERRWDGRLGFEILKVCFWLWVKVILIVFFGYF